MKLIAVACILASVLAGPEHFDQLLSWGLLFAFFAWWNNEI